MASDRLVVVPVEDERARREFLSFPYLLYRNHAYWVPPLRIAQKELLNPAKHPFHKFATVREFLALRDGRTVGRIAAILDPHHNEFHSERTGFFGFLEMVNDPSVARSLLETARGWLRQLGMEVIRGPMNPSTNYECGLLVDGFDSSPRVMMTYNYPYYGPLVEQAGLWKAKDLFAYDVQVVNAKAARVESLLGRSEKAGLRIRPVSIPHFPAEAERVWEVYNAAWERNWGFVPMTRDEFFHHAGEMKPVLVPQLALLAEYGNETVGCALAIPDINEALKHIDGRLFPFGLFKLLWYKRRIHTLRVVILGVRKEWRTTPAAAGLYATLIRNAGLLGYLGAEGSWVLEDNVLMRRAIESLGGTIYKTYRIYEWK